MIFITQPISKWCIYLVKPSKYEILEIGNTEKLYIDDNERGFIYILDNTLRIDDGIFLDGFLTVFEKE